MEFTERCARCLLYPLAQACSRRIRPYSLVAGSGTLGEITGNKITTTPDGIRSKEHALDCTGFVDNNVSVQIITVVFILQEVLKKPEPRWV